MEIRWLTDSLNLSSVDETITAVLHMSLIFNHTVGLWVKVVKRIVCNNIIQHLCIKKLMKLHSNETSSGPSPVCVCVFTL